MPRAQILGAGVAGLTCAKLLLAKGWEVALWSRPAGPAPVVMLNDVTSSLLVDVWGGLRDLLGGAHELRERGVLWGAEPARVAERSFAVDTGELAAALLDMLVHDHRNRLRLHDLAGPGEGAPTQPPPLAPGEGWVINAGGRSSRLDRTEPVRRQRFGHRYVVSATVGLTPGASAQSAWVELVPDGWLFLAPLGPEQAVLQGMVPQRPNDALASLRQLLAQSGLIRQWVGDVGPLQLFAAAPTQSNPLCGPGWCSVGDAACSFDPLCGDGIGYALRGSILAAAVLGGVADGLPVDDCLNHYSQRLDLTFRSHLRDCMGFYAGHVDTEPWRDELERMQAAPLPVTLRSGVTGRFLFGLKGSELVRLDD